MWLTVSTGSSHASKLRCHIYLYGMPVMSPARLPPTLTVYFKPPKGKVLRSICGQRLIVLRSHITGRCWVLKLRHRPIRSVILLYVSYFAHFMSMLRAHKLLIIDYKVNMRLLDTSTYLFKWFDDPHEVRYAILSHVWAKDGEQTYQQILSIQPPDEEVFKHKLLSKIWKACEVARQHGFQYIWIDSCCIDKTSSAELSEAINSMYAWYRCAEVCYAYLQDVDEADPPQRTNSQFRRAEWFKRGWTLQELLAPNTLLFLSKTWTVIGTKHSLAKEIHEITSIDTQILRGQRKLSDASVAERMSWASDRVTTKVEDGA